MHMSMGSRTKLAPAHTNGADWNIPVRPARAAMIIAGLGLRVIQPAHRQTARGSGPRYPEANPGTASPARLAQPRTDQSIPSFASYKLRST
jgi:hypothetical protein